jgi:alkaline phosphatase
MPQRRSPLSVRLGQAPASLAFLIAGLVVGPIAGAPVPGLTRALGAQEPIGVIFFHPDGMGVNYWAALRLAEVGPDGRLRWDELPHMAVYTGHMSDALTATSNGAATVHAYGVKVKASSYGLDGGKPLTALSGHPGSILQEAAAAGYAVGIVNSGTITEPGTGAFAASVVRRSNHAEIVNQILETGPEVILGGGERFFLPEGTQGVHGPGVRSDGRNVVEEARALGYAVVYDRAQLLSLPDTVSRVLGLFASNHTFNARSEERLKDAGLPHYWPDAPSIGEMSQVALRVMSRSGRRFLLVVEEEGTDNFANATNASGSLTAARRADEAIGIMQRYMQDHPSTLLLLASDSDAGGLQAIGPPPGGWLTEGEPVPERTGAGAPLDGVDGTASPPFMSKPDRAGARWPFAIGWVTSEDVSGGILVRAAGLNADQVHGVVDATDIYRIMYRTLFERSPD